MLLTLALNQTGRRTVLTVVIFVLLCCGIPPSYAQDPSVAPAFIELNAKDVTSMQSAIAGIEAHGGRCIHRFPVHACVGELPTDMDTVLLHEAIAASVHRGSLRREELVSPDENSDLALAVWQSNFLEPDKALLGQRAEPPAPPNDALLPPASPARLQSNISSAAPGNMQTGEFMIGNIAVGIILPESNGSIDPDTENWSVARQDQAVAGIASALNWWAAREPRARLSFTYRVERSVPTGYEPIVHPQSEESLWIGEVMGRLGHGSANYFSNVLDYVNGLRTAYGTDWAFAAIVVDDLNDVDNKFSDGYFAYAYVGGPFLVLTYDSDGYGNSNLGAVAAHEIGHLFFALDEYVTAGVACDTRSGYLDVQTANSLSPAPNVCGSNTLCIMRGQIAPFSSGQLCASTREQVGWRDSDGNGLFDPVDTSVALSVGLTGSRRTLAGTVRSYTGLASDVPWASPRRTPVTINGIEGVQYRVNEGEWQWATPADGTWHKVSEQFTFSVTVAGPNPETVEVQAFDTVGYHAIYTLTVEGSAQGSSYTTYLPLMTKPSVSP